MKRPGILSLGLSLAAAACGVGGETTVIKLAHGLDPTHSVHLAMEYMAERVAEESGGTMRIDIYPSEQLGTERQALPSTSLYLTR